MKKLFYIAFAFVIFNLFYSSIYADTEKIASCVYDAENVINGEAPSKFIINVDKNYQIEYEFLAYTEKRKECADPNSKEYESYGCNQISFNVKTDFDYGDFITDTKFECKNIPKIYHTNELDIAHMVVDYTFNKTSSSELTGVYVLNEEASKINSENPALDDSENGWLYTCHFNSIVLKFNKSDYEVIGGHKLNNTNLLNEIANNNYSCPVKYCYWDTNVDGIYGQFLIEDIDPHIGTETCFYSAIYSDDEYTCGGISAIMKEFDKANESYISTGDINHLISRNNIEDKAKSFCQSVLVNSGYNDPNNCVKECLKIESDILSKIGETNPDSGKCGFSWDLINWIANIVKWGKYLIPVIVIVLGILDFIKAMSSDKDDEMKKAQGSFVKRLIAAALIFIVPFIIEFVLDMMGFNSNGCGIIDL